jgi:hypothetical protein
MGRSVAAAAYRPLARRFQLPHRGHVHDAATGLGPRSRARRRHRSRASVTCTTPPPVSGLDPAYGGTDVGNALALDAQDRIVAPASRNRLGYGVRAGARTALTAFGSRSSVS